MHITIAKKLIEIANELDTFGLHKEADSLTELVRVAQMPGQSGWTPNSAAGTAQAPQPAPPNPAQQAQQQAQQQQTWNIPNVRPDLSQIANTPLIPPTSYNGPQTPYPSGGYQGWYGGNQNSRQYGYGQPNAQGQANNTIDPQALQKQLMNTSISPFAVVKTMPNGKQVVQQGPTLQDMVNKYTPQFADPNNPDATVENARQKMIQQRMEEYKQMYWKLWQEAQNQWAGDGNPQLYQ